MKINRLKQLSDAKLVFAFGEAVPSEEQIQHRSVALDAWWLTAVDIGLHLLAVGSILMGCISFYWLVAYPALFGGNDNLATLTWILNWVAPGLVGVVLYVAVESNASLIRSLVLEEGSLTPIAPGDCEAMLAACDATAEGVAYRDKVIAADRRFVQAELQLLQDWANNQQQREKCSRLYGIKEDK